MPVDGGKKTTDLVMAQLYQAGHSLKEVAAILGCDRKLVKRHLKAQGVPIRPGNSIKRSEWLKRSKSNRP